MPDIIITPSIGKLEFIDNSAQVTRRHSFTLDHSDGLVLDAPLSAAAISAPLNVINVTVNNSNANYPFVLAQSGETGAKNLLMDGTGGTYNPSTNTATIDISGNSATTTLASDSTNLGGVVAASYVTLTGTQTLTNKTITGTFTGNLTGTGSWATNAVSAISATTATNSTQLNGQAASYYTNIPARLGYTPVNQAGDTIGNLTVNGNFTVNGSFTAFSASNIYLSSSVLSVEDNILTLNAFSPYLRYAGIEMYDSGSGTLSQLLWDGEGDYFFLTGSSVNGKIITGPDNQANLSSNYVPKATAGYKLGNSLIYDNGTGIGMGTTTPVGRLEVNGGSLATTSGSSIIVGSFSSGVSNSSYLNIIETRFATGSDWQTARTRIQKTIDVTNQAYIDFNPSGSLYGLALGTGAGGIERVRIDSTGNVGIGITNPGYKLDVGVAGSDVISVRLTPGYERVRFNTFDLLGYNDGNLWMIGNNPTNTLVLGKTWDWDNQIGIAYTPGTVGNSGGILQIGQISKNNANYTHGITRLYTNGLERITIIANGNVGIGTTLPTTPLHVVGVISGSSFSGAGTGLTGTAASLTAGTVTTNANLTGDVTSTGNATTIATNAVTTTKINSNSVTFAKFQQVAALSVVGVSGNSTANVAAIAGSANQVLRVSNDGTALAFGQVNLAQSQAVTGTLAINNGGTGAATAQLAINALAGAVTNGQYLRGNGTNVVMSAIQAADVPTLNQNTTGTAATATTVNGTNGQLLFKDIRAIAPNNIAAGYLQFGFTTWTNTLSTSPYADYLHLRSYTDSSGGNDNLVMFRKDAIGMRIWQQTFGSASNYSTYKDVAFTDSIGNGTITIAAGTGVGVGTTNTFTTNQSGATTVTISNTGVTSNVAGTGISVSGATGAVTITNSGVTSAVAGTGVGVSAATGAVTFSIGQAVGPANTPSFAGIISSAVTNYAFLQTTDTNNFWITPGNNNWGLYFETSAGGLLGGTGDSNRLGFVGAGTARFYVDLNNGNGWFGGALTAAGNISAANLSGTNTGDQTVGNGTITIAAGTGVGVGSSNTFTTNQSGNSTVTITNTGVTSAVAGTGVGVSAGTGAVTFSIGQAVGTGNTPTFAGLVSTGNIGIGSTSPAALLNIRASVPTGTGTVTTGTNILLDSNTSNYITFRNTSDNGTYAGLTFLDNNTGGYIVFRNYTAEGVTAGSDCMIYGSYQDHIFQNSASETINGKTETMRIKSNGYIGINTNNPTARLQVVQGNSGGVAAILLSSDESTIQGPSANTQIRMGSNLVLNASGIIPIGTNGSERVRIDSSGNVGVGTSNPGRKLDVEGIVRTRGASGTGGFEIGAATTGVAKWRIEWDSASDSLDFNWVG